MFPLMTTTYRNRSHCHYLPLHQQQLAFEPLPATTTQPKREASLLPDVLVAARPHNELVLHALRAEIVALVAHKYFEAAV